MKFPLHHRILLKRFFLLFFAMMLFHNCKGYKEPITLEQAQADRLDYVKVTLNNGDSQVFELIEYNNGAYVGVHKENGEQIRTELDTTEVVEVRQKNKKSSWFSSFIGVLLGAGSAALVVLMFSN